MGSVLTLVEGADVRFKTRPVEGARPAPGTKPERLIPDGRQRLTSLYQSMLDLSNREHEYASRMFPCAATFEQYQVPVIELGKSTPRQAMGKEPQISAN